MSWPKHIHAGHPQSAGFAARQPITSSVTAGGAGGFRRKAAMSASCSISDALDDISELTASAESSFAIKDVPRPFCRKSLYNTADMFDRL
jgi:hypothetical protein